MARLQARLNLLSAPAAGLTGQPAARAIGSFDRGQDMCAGRFRVAGHRIEAPDTSLWDLPVVGDDARAELHGFGWLDDLAAAGSAPAQRLARDWVLDWIARYGRGQGPGWAPGLTGRRLLRLLQHAVMLLNGAEKAESDALFRALGHQAAFLARRWQAAPPCLPRVEALAGLVHAALYLAGAERHLDPALQALVSVCDDLIDDSGGLPTRNPEELLEVFTLVAWTSAALAETAHRPVPALRGAIHRIAPALRALRHADGGLARFHGGGAGRPGALDRVLADSRVRPVPHSGLAMGFARMAAGRTSVIVDAAPPPATEFSANAHASTLAFELTSGRRPLVVSCGPGRALGEEWHRAGRATPSHSTLAIDGYSSSRLGHVPRPGAAQLLAERPGKVEVRQESGFSGQSLTAWHDGYVATHGLTHVRQLMLSYDGRSLSGEETLAAFAQAERATLEKVLAASAEGAVGFALRFHLHPDVAGQAEEGRSAVWLTLKSGEVWEFRHDGTAKLTLEPSVYLIPGPRRPRPTRQIVLSARLMDYASVLTWKLSKRQQDAARPPRDLDRGGLLGDEAGG